MDLKKFFKKLSLFLALPVLFCLVIILVDPYNYFNVSRLFTNETKINTSVKIEPVLWKMIDFKRNPAGNIILGDSRAQNIKCSLVEELSGEKYYNLGCQGGEVPEFIDLFWYAESLVPIKKVFIVINFDSFSQYITVSRVPRAKIILGNPLLYLIDRQVIRSVYYNIERQLFCRDFVMDMIKMTKEKFWDFRLKERSTTYSHYAYPHDFYLGLKKISLYCRDHSIPLVFVIMPTHVELQELIDKYSLREEEKRFKDGIRGLGLVYDFDQKNALTENKDNFLDPCHANQKIVEYVVRNVWGGASKD